MENPSRDKRLSAFRRAYFHLASQSDLQFSLKDSDNFVVIFVSVSWNKEIVVVCVSVDLDLTNLGLESLHRLYVNNGRLSGEEIHTMVTPFATFMVSEYPAMVNRWRKAFT